MGILSGLLKMIPVVGPIAGGIADMAGKSAGGAAAGRQQDTQNLLTQDQLRNQQYSTAQNAQMNAGQLDLQRKGFTEDARGGRAKQALIASILGGGFQPTQVSVPGIKNAQISGGLAESLKNPGAQASMQELLKQALSAQLAGADGEQFSGGAILPPPAMSALPKAGKLENILGGVGLGGSLLSSVLANIKQDSGGA